MKLMYLMLLMLFFGLAQSKDDMIRDEQASQTMSQWQKSLYHHLLQHENPELKAYGVYYLSNMDMTYGQMTDRDKELIEPVVDQIIKHPASTHHALWLITELCDDDQILPDCDIGALLAAQVNNHGDNLLSYMFPLRQAMNSGIEGEVIDWVTRMSHSSEYGFSWEYSVSFEQALNAFVEEEPIPQDMFNKELEQLVVMAELSEHELTYFNDNRKHYELVYQKILHDLKMPFPAFKTLTDACENYQELHQACVTIGQIMVRDGNQYISLIIGHKLQSIALNNIGQVKQAELAEDSIKAFKSEIECLRDLVNYPPLPLMDLTLLDENMLVKRGQGEREALFHWARKQFELALEADDDQAEKLDPEVCRFDHLANKEIARGG